jgi:hypothetical protein
MVPLNGTGAGSRTVWREPEMQQAPILKPGLAFFFGGSLYPIPSLRH